MRSDDIAHARSTCKDSAEQLVQKSNVKSIDLPFTGGRSTGRGQRGGEILLRCELTTGDWIIVTSKERMGEYHVKLSYKKNSKSGSPETKRTYKNDAITKQHIMDFYNSIL